MKDDKVYWLLFKSRSEAELYAKEILGKNKFVTYGISFEQGLYPMII